MFGFYIDFIQYIAPKKSMGVDVCGRETIQSVTIPLKGAEHQIKECFNIKLDFSALANKLLVMFLWCVIMCSSRSASHFIDMYHLRWPKNPHESLRARAL